MSNFDIFEQNDTMRPSMFQKDETVCDEYPMRAVLLESDGLMRELWLPVIKEGKFTFSGVELPLSIVAENGAWIAAMGEGGHLETLSQQMFRAVRIHDHSLVIAVFGEHRYTLYVEADRGKENVFLPYYVERKTEVLIGRLASCDLRCDNPYISREHAALSWDGAYKWTIRDMGSTNGVYVNGKSVRAAELTLGSVIYIMGVFIIIGSGYITINNADGRVSLMSPKVRPVMSARDLIFPKPVGWCPTDYFDRKPRKKQRLSADPIDIETPPPPISPNKVPLPVRLGSQAVMGGSALISGNVVSALTSLVFPAMTQGITEKDKKEYEEKRRTRYREYLAAKQEEIRKEIDYEQRYLNDLYPCLQQTLAFVTDKTRLWERRKIDEDFLTVRLGSGDQEMMAEKNYQPRGFEMEPDYLVNEMYSVADAPSRLHNVPVTVNLKENWVLGMVGERAKTVRIVKNMIASLAVTHAYDELKIVLFVDRGDIEAFNFTRYLRHFWDNDRSIRFLATDMAEAQTIAKYISGKWSSISGLDNNQRVEKELKKRESYALFVLNKDLFDGIEFFKDLLSSDSYAGVSLVAAFDNPPKECTKLLDLRDGSSVVDLVHPEMEDQQLTADELASEWIDNSMRMLSCTNLRLDSQTFSLPSMITFLDMFGVGRIEHLNPIARWADNNPVKSLAAPIGVGTDGKLFSLDLHEKRQGPHGLVAGMTGSGKSEFIITYILSMAVNYSPDEVAFILIDYKGGGLTDAFEDKTRGIHLPHLVGTITNLDGAAIQRSLMSINSELKRRQSEFKKAKSETNFGTMDIYDYQKLYRSKRVKKPMPHLFIISDEFAELKKQQPEFMDELISTARIGRSLGVHLILATQKPGGVVNDQIWSNTKFRVCLKVQDRGDSMEMLKRPEAAELKHTGRFYLQVGYNEFFALGQSAWCGAAYAPKDEAIVEKDESVEFVDTTGQTIFKAGPEKKVNKSDCKQIVAVVQYLSDLAKREEIHADSLWLEPLAEKIELGTLLEKCKEERYEHITSVLGMVDDPERQSQYMLKLDLQSFHHMLLCGQSGSGKSTFIRTMLYSLMYRYTPEEVNYYILDLSSGALNAFRSMPHCGAYVTEENEGDFDRMLSLIKGLTEERKKLFAEADVFGYDAYVKTHKLPLVLVIIDGWTNINSFKRGQEYSLSIGNYMREASNYGIRYILTVNHINEASAKAKQELDYRIALRAKDKFDYNDILNVRGTPLPPEKPGRGVCVIDGRPLEYHVAVLNCSQDDQKQNAMLKSSLAELAERDKGIRPAKMLPIMDDTLEYDTFCSSFDLHRIPLGFSVEQMKPVAIPLQQLYTMSLYFGNPIGIKPVFSNLISAFLREDADVIIVRRRSDTVFNLKLSNQLKQLFQDRCTVLDTTAEDLGTLEAMVIENIQNGKKQLRDAYCEANDIPSTDKGRTKKAAKYIREGSKPLFVLMESFADLTAVEIDQTLKSELCALFSQIKGYNVYFIGCFYPEDENAATNPLTRSFTKEGFSLLFGGCFDKQWFTTIPAEYKRMEKVNPRYNRYIMKYRSDWVKMIMPCGELSSGVNDPDEAEIL